MKKEIINFYKRTFGFDKNFFKITQIICLIICLPLLYSCNKYVSQGNQKATGNISKLSSPEWPVLRSYDREHTYRIALPLGGIGTGTVSLGGRGNLQDWEIMNRPAKGYNPSTGRNNSPFFVLYTKTEDKKDIRLLEGPIPFYLYEGSMGAVATNHGLPRFSENSFETAYPFGQVKLKTPQLPVDVKIKAFNPLIPGDVNNSSIPVAILDFELTNNSDKEITFSICGSMPNFIGEDGTKGKASENKNTFKKEHNFKGVLLTSEGVEPNSDQWGEISLISPSEGEVSYRTDWLPIRWGGDSMLDFWDDFSKDGKLENREDSFSDKPMASLAISNTLPPGSSKTVKFIISWYFPNRTAWADESMTNYYTTKYSGAWDVVKKTMPNIDYLENKTIDFVNAFCNSDLPPEVIEAALFNISTLRTQTCFRLSDGNFFAWEGCNDRSGSCAGSCTHVWNYETATAFLFGDLARSMRKVEGIATNEEGLMSFRVKLPLIKIPDWNIVAADGQMGCIMKLYREWQLSGDDDFLAKLYPKSKAALSYAWEKGSWDADQDGVMEGVQHNTMDVEYFGPNPQMTIWYLGALRAMEEMALYMHDDQMARKCRELFNNGSKWTDNNLFNGEYYIHKIIPPDIKNIPEEQVIGMGTTDYANPDYQLGEGCLVDQLVGQYMSHVCGLGYLINKENVSKTLQSIMKYNYRPSLSDHFNCMRSYALGDEAALLMASYPRTRPENPFPYFTEVMTGFEYTAAIGMLQEGQIENGLKCIRNIRSRYDGRKRNPFNEAECGHHYGRAMASWSALLALTGFQYSAVTATLSFGNITGIYFWSTGYSYGTVEIIKNGKSELLTINVMGGKINVSEIIIKDTGKVIFEEPEILNEGYKETFEII